MQTLRESVALSGVVLREPCLADRTRVPVAAVTADHPQHIQDAARRSGHHDPTSERQFHATSYIGPMSHRVLKRVSFHAPTRGVSPIGSHRADDGGDVAQHASLGLTERSVAEIDAQESRYASCTSQKMCDDAG
jgi:hypothetical protein